MTETFTIGIDFGTESGRAVVVRVRDGAELASAVTPYPDGVIDQTLPGTSTRLGDEWALQNPLDYLHVLKTAVPEAVRTSGVDPRAVAGVAIDFTACTMLPVKGDGTPLMALPEFRGNPHAWVKLWKHHAAQPHADRVTATAAARGEAWLPRYGGKISSEWFLAKALQILEEAPEIYRAADRLIEAADWVIWRMCGVETRNTCTAGYKANFQDGAYPTSDYLGALNPGFADLVASKLSTTLAPLGGRAGDLTAEAAGWMGLPAGIAVAVANVDAHVTVPAAGVVEPGRLVAIMGTSTCHMLLGDRLTEVPGMCGVVDGGIIPGLYGYEAGQSGVGDIFAWFVKHAVPNAYGGGAGAGAAHEALEREAAAQKPGDHGLLALDWWNGNRSVLVDANLSGLLIGMTLATRAPDIYRALIEVDRLRHAPHRRELRALRRPGARAGDCRRPAEEPAADADLRRRDRPSAQPGRLRAGPGAGLGHARGRRRRPLPHDCGCRRPHGPHPPQRLHAGSRRRPRLRPALRRLRRPARLLRPRRERRDEAPEGRWSLSMSVDALRRDLASLHLELPRNGLVTWTSGNISARDFSSDTMLIKPSGVTFEALTPDSLVQCNYDGRVLAGRFKPSSDTATHGYIYRHMPSVGGIVHTHSPYATAWAANAREIPCILTAMADEFGGPIPCGGFAMIGGEEIGHEVVRVLTGHRSPAIILQSHGVFTVGPTPRAALKAAVMCEDVARTAFLAHQLGDPRTISVGDIDRLYERYTTKYGQ